jgi:drug/metabolite transporter (DMT)-like permease
MVINLENAFYNPKQKCAYLLLLSTTLLWSTGGVLVKWISCDPMTIAGMRSLLAIPMLLLFFRGNRFTWSVAQIGAALCYAANVILFVVSTRLTTAANAIVLQYMAPVYVAIFSGVFLQERIRKIDWVVIVIALSGMCLFFKDKLTADNYLGNILAILGGICFGFYIIFMRMQKDAFPLGSVLLGNIIAAIIAMPFMFRSFPSAGSWGGLILLGVFQLGLSHALYSAAIKHVTAFASAMIFMIEPILNPLWVFLFLGELPGKWSAAGGVIVITSVVWYSLSRLSVNVSKAIGVDKG